MSPPVLPAPVHSSFSVILMEYHNVRNARWVVQVCVTASLFFLRVGTLPADTQPLRRHIILDGEWQIKRLDSTRRGHGLAEP